MGSSTVYPFAAYVAEELGATTDICIPVVEPTGSGGGFKLFCNGVGEDTRHTTNASRRAKPSELVMGSCNGVTDIAETMVGSDGIPALDLRREQFTLTVAPPSTEKRRADRQLHTRWSNIDDSLPGRKIHFYNPPTFSGTREAFEESVLAYGLEQIDSYADKAHATIRRDGPYTPSGENNNLIAKNSPGMPMPWASPVIRFSRKPRQDTGRCHRQRQTRTRSSPRAIIQSRGRCSSM